MRADSDLRLTSLAFLLMLVGRAGRAPRAAADLEHLPKHEPWAVFEYCVGQPADHENRESGRSSRPIRSPAATVMEREPDDDSDIRALIVTATSFSNGVSPAGFRAQPRFAPTLTEGAGDSRVPTNPSPQQLDIVRCIRQRFRSRAD